eukprot:SAG11_NODE_2931_length_2830_cov_2.053094_1_plen_62_part_00
MAAVAATLLLTGTAAASVVPLFLPKSGDRYIYSSRQQAVAACSNVTMQLCSVSGRLLPHPP